MFYNNLGWGRRGKLGFPTKDGVVGDYEVMQSSSNLGFPIIISLPDYDLKNKD